MSMEMEGKRGAKKMKGIRKIRNTKKKESEMEN